VIYLWVYKGKGILTIKSPFQNLNRVEIMKTQWQKEIEKMHQLEVATLQTVAESRKLDIRKNELALLQQITVTAVGLAFILSFFI
jgi:hypothetical protein